MENPSRFFPFAWHPLDLSNPSLRAQAVSDVNHLTVHLPRWPIEGERLEEMTRRKGSSGPLKWRSALPSTHLSRKELSKVFLGILGMWGYGYNITC